MIRTAQRILVLAAVSLFVGLGGSGVFAEPAGPCAHAGQGDRDHDGLSNCMEKRVYGTSHRDYDTDDDGIPDPDEVEDGTDPTNADTDDDGVDDGKEGDCGCSPTDPDSDDDGMPDGEDSDPGDELDSAIKGNATELACPTDVAAGSLKVLGISIKVTAETEFEDVESCAALAEKGGAHVTVKVSGDLAPELVAHKIKLEDSDHDGCPNGVDDDDDNDGAPDGGDDGEGEGGDDGSAGGDGEGGGDGELE